MSKDRTEAQKEATRKNGAKSKGPTTPEGKARVSQNAITHGLTAKRVVLCNEDPACWDALHQNLTSEWQPETLAEMELVDDLASARWRLCRVLDFEAALMDLEILKSYDAFQDFYPGGDLKTLNAVSWQALNKDGTLPAIHRQEARLRRLIKDLMKQLMEMKALRQKSQVSAPARQPEKEPKQPGKPEVQNKPEPNPAATPIRQNKPETAPQNHPDSGPRTLPGGPKAA